MKNLLKIPKLSAVLILLIGIGFNADSQKTITDWQLKQIRLLENRAMHDSLMLIQKNIETDSLYKLVSFQDRRIQNCTETTGLMNQKIGMLNDLYQNEKNKQIVYESEIKSLKRMVVKRNITILAMTIIEAAYFTYCLIK